MPGGFCDSFVDMKLVGSFPSQTEKTPPFEPLVCHRDQVDYKPTPLRHLIMLVIPSNPSLPHLYRGRVKHDADGGTERTGREVVAELSADDTRVACEYLSDRLLDSFCFPGNMYRERG